MSDDDLNERCGGEYCRICEPVDSGPLWDDNPYTLWTDDE